MTHRVIDLILGQPPSTSQEEKPPDFTNSIKKLPFMLHKLGYSKSDLKYLLAKYREIYGSQRDRRLPPDYIGRVEKFISERPH